MKLTQKQKEAYISNMMMGSLVFIIACIVFTMCIVSDTVSSVEGLVESAANPEQAKNAAKDAKSIMDSMTAYISTTIASISFVIAVVGIATTSLVNKRFEPVVTVSYVKDGSQESEEPRYYVVICNEGTQNLYLHKAYLGTEEQTSTEIKDTVDTRIHMLEMGKPVSLSLDDTQSLVCDNHQDVNVYLSTNLGRVECSKTSEFWKPKQS